MSVAIFQAVAHGELTAEEGVALLVGLRPRWRARLAIWLDDVLD